MKDLDNLIRWVLKATTAATKRLSDRISLSKNMYVPDSVPASDRNQMIMESEFGKRNELKGNFAVLIVDMTREFVDSDHPNAFPEAGKPAARAIARLMDVAREYGIRGYYSRSMKGNHRVEAGRWGDTNTKEQEGRLTKIADDLSPAEDDIIFEKYKPSVFFGTQLESMLNYSNVDSLVITGMTTSGCVRATAVDAFSYNYRVVIPEECVADRSQISHEISLFDLEMKYADVYQLEDLLERLKGL